MGWILSFVLFLVVAFLLGAPWWVLVMLCLAAGIVGLLVELSRAFRWPGW